MSAPFLAEIRMFGCNFAPTGWAQCNGQILPIYQNTALFALLGTMYGGNGHDAFALPDLQGSSPVSWGQSTTGTQYFQGQQSGTPSVTLIQSEIPAHNHQPRANTAAASGMVTDPANGAWGPAPATRSQKVYASTANTKPAMYPLALSMAGGSLPHTNMQPYLVVNFCIAIQGVFPARP